MVEMMHWYASNSSVVHIGIHLDWIRSVCGEPILSRNRTTAVATCLICIADADEVVRIYEASEERRASRKAP